MGIYDITAKDGKGIELLDFPCSQFGNQALSAGEEIAKFFTERFGVTYKQFAKIEASGENESPLYTWLKNQKSGIAGSIIKWNFTKFLVDRNGNVVTWYAPLKNPTAIDNEINKLLEGE